MTPDEIDERYDASEYDAEAMKLDLANGNFREEQAEDYRHENIVRTSLINGQFTQDRMQCVEYGLNYELEKYKFDHPCPSA